MSEMLILVGLLAIVVERGVEPFMNIVQASFKQQPKKGEHSLQQVAYRSIALGLAIVFGLLITRLCGIDLIKEIFPNSGIKYGWLLTGFIIGLGSAPTHEVVNYIEQKKNKAKEETRIARGTPPGSPSDAPQ